MGHLMLKRRRGEGVYVGQDVLITVVEVSGHSVRLCVQAPKGVPVMRAELLPDDECVTSESEGEP